MSQSKSHKHRPIRSGTNSTHVEKTAENIHSAFIAHLTRKRAINGVVAIFVIAALIGGYTWYNHVYTSPERVFWSMVDNNLSTKSVTRETSQNDGQATNKGLTQLSFNPTPVVRDTKDISAQDTSGPVHVVLETISTPKGDYQHYAHIDRAVAQGEQKKDYSAIYPLWVDSKNTSSDVFSNLFVNSIFGPVLFGNLNKTERSALTKQLHSSYKVDFSKVKKQNDHRRGTYTYKVDIPMREYTKTANQYARMLNLRKDDQFKASNYSAKDKLSISITVGIMSRQITQIKYSSSGGDMVEKYSGYGIASDVKIPKKTVSYDQLQKAIANISQ